MAYKPILAPEDFHAWLQSYAKQHGVSMAAIMRELPAKVEAADALGVRPAQAGNGKQQQVQQVPA